jgi:hypothetical protein
VNIRATLTEAEYCGIVGPDLAARLTTIAKALFYKDRTYTGIMKGASESGLAAARLQDFAASLPQMRIDRKRHDAALLLDTVRAHLAAKLPPLRVAYQFAETAAWEAARRYALG